MSISQNFPTIRSSLLLDFVNTKRLDPRITFTRASSATYFDQLGVLQSAANNIPRFDYNPSTLAPRGLLIEEQRTNLATYSQEPSDAAWNKTRASITADTVVAPDGTLTGDKLVEDATANNTHRTSIAAVSVVSGSSYTWSIYLKAGERTFAYLALNNTSGGNAFTTWPSFYVNLLTGEITDASATVTASSAVNVGNGWFRVSVSATATSTTTQNPAILLATASGTNSYTGDGTSGIYIWGAQLEAGAFATSYIPTTTTALTRSADVASMTGTNFSSWFNAVEGTIFCQGIGVNNVATGTRRYFEINNNTSDERVLAGYGFTTSCRYVVSDGGATQADISVTTTTGGVSVKMAAAYKVNDFQQASNGTLGTADTSGTLPTVDRMFIGQAETTAAATMLNGYIQRIAYYPTRLADAQLQALTA